MLWLILILFSISVGYELRILYNVIYFVGDAFLFCAPMWLWGRKSRWYSVFVIWLISIYLISSALYFRFWGDLLPLSAIFNTANWNHLVFESAWHYVAWFDVAIIALVLCYTIVSFNGKLKFKSVLSRKMRIAGFVTSIIIWFMTVCINYLHEKRYNAWCQAEFDAMQFFESKTDAFIFSNYLSFQGGVVWYFIQQIHNTISVNKHFELLAEQENEIKATLSRKVCQLTKEEENLLKQNTGKNLIFIIVESLNSAEIGHKVNGMSITPVLDSLLNSVGTVSALNMLPQISVGGSSDGQLIYNTGLLPIASGITVQQYDKNEYFSLAKILNKKAAAEFIVEDASIWNHRSTNQAYGYDKIYDVSDLQAAGFYENEIGGDAAVFSFASQKIQEMPRPFFAEIVTLSMHFPFVDSGVPDIDKDDIELRYYISLNYFDRELGLFLGRLKQKGLYDDSIIVIASDHDVRIKGGQRGEQPICFMALNTGITKKIIARSWQSDVFPTILDIMGVGDDNAYRGLGESLLVDSLNCRDESFWLKTQQVSEWIIRSNYFRQN